MPCVNKVIHDFPDGAKVCCCGAAGLIEKPKIAVDSAPPTRCFVCGEPCVRGSLSKTWDTTHGYHHETCNPERVCKCGALAPEGKIWSDGHCCYADFPKAGNPCAEHDHPSCFAPDPLYKPKPKTFTLEEVMALDGAALVEACERRVLGGMATLPPPLDWNFAMRCRDAAARDGGVQVYKRNLYILAAGRGAIVGSVPADYCRAALLTVAGV